MRILFVHPITKMSIGDVARGYRSALERQGHDIEDYWMGSRYQYHQKAVPEKFLGDTEIVSRQASETIPIEAMYYNADLVLVISGLNINPIALWLVVQVMKRDAVVL